MKIPFNKEPNKVIQGENREIYCFEELSESSNVDASVVEGFGEEWEKFNAFDQAEIDKVGDMYFDIVPAKALGKDKSCIDIGCGSGRWSKYLIDKVGYIDALDPSKAIVSADKLLGKNENIRLSMSTTDQLPFADNSFDFGMSIGVLHHIPDTQQAMKDCVAKIKTGGYFYTYLYYNMENRGLLFKSLFGLADGLRRVVCSLPANLKKVVCDLIAIFIYMPFVLLGRALKSFGLKSLAKKIPLEIYQDTTFFVIRNDALDRFGTKLEQRFSRSQIQTMMSNAGLSEIVISEGLPYWHAIGIKR